ncbi:hypothetical protein VKT23_011525 [Stygiomarasmius scandens]|uniref:CBM1 domain-containing protein n=1 Tax=Marasmiellus scandens TaxID=2682957 RepID=A0ABR1JD66_9AGAR
MVLVNWSSLVVTLAVAIRSVSSVAIQGQSADAEYSTNTTLAPRTADATFTNPVFWEDLADLDIIRVGTTYYYSASTMHYSPGAPILRSYDLVNWEYIGHSVPSLDFGDNDYSLVGGRAYVRGIWASSLKWRPSTSTFHWLGCIDFAKTYVYTSQNIDSGWAQRSVINNCYYDAGMLVDDDGTIYVAYGNTQISVAQLSSDGLSEVTHKSVYSSTVGSLEGNRFYKKGGAYYILVTRPASDEYVLKSTSGPFGPYTIRSLSLAAVTPISGGGNPHQGGLIDTPNGDWYYMAFNDAYPGGRVPVLAPVTWSSDGWPTLTNGNRWPTSLNYPLTQHNVKSPTGTDTFTSIGPEWEWNHNPDNNAWSISNGLVLRTATVTTDLYSARNTITHRILGPKSTGTILLDFTNMADGDRAGLAMLRDTSAWIGVKRTGNTKQLVMVNGLTMSSTWTTSSTGSEIATASISGNQIYLRLTADIAPSGAKNAVFSYSTDGQTFTTLGNTLALNTAWQFFMGYRFGIFNYATKATGGSVTVKSFTLQSGTGGAISGGSTGSSTGGSTGGGSTGGGSTSGGSSGTVPQYGQCGGIGYSGPTQCASGSTCTVSNPYYSQCL